MTAPVLPRRLRHRAQLTAVLDAVQARDNVVYLTDFRPDAPPPAPDRDAPLQSPARPAAAGRVPARWSPRPLRVIGRRFARSQLAADLREYGHTLALLAGLLAGVLLAEHVHALIQPLFGGPPS